MLTKEQIELRKSGIGSSDIARIICFDKWQVWAEKTGRSDGIPINAAMRRGNALEPVIASLYAERLEIDEDDIFKGTTYRDVWRLATPDYIVDTEKHILECKAPAYRIGWGEEWTDEIPRQVIIQTQWQMGVLATTRRYCHVATLIGNDHLIYRVDFDYRLYNLLEKIGHDFWHKYVLTDTPPPADETDSATRWLNKLYPSNNGVMLNRTEETCAMVDSLHYMNDRLKVMNRDKVETENQLKEIIGDADGIDGLCTWKKDKNGNRRFRLLKEE